MAFLIFFVALSIMVFVHELGHFLMAKKQGVKVEEFGFGYPPRLWGKKVGETIYSINLIPMGGFVRIWGMEERVKKEKKRAFYTQTSKSQFLILVAGVAMNFLLAVLVFSLVYGITGVPKKIGKVKIIEVAAGSPAEKAGLKKDLFIVKICQGSFSNCRSNKAVEVKHSKDFIEIVRKWAGGEVVLVSEDGREFSVIPRKNPPPGEGALGIIITDSSLVKPPFWRRIPLGIWYGFKDGVFWGGEIAKGVGQMIGGIFKGKIPTGVVGPVGVYVASSDIYRENGLLAAIHFFAVVSVNLVVVNLLPFPGADGWHAGILIIEKIRRQELKEKTKRRLNQAGMIFILLLSFLIIAADIKRFILK